MPHPLMPKATAVWLVENTALAFDQIADFCGLHHLEVQAIADGEVAAGMQGLDPITAGELTQDEITRCLTDPKARLKMAKPNIPQPKARAKGARYTPVSKRQDRPDAIAWLLRNHPELADAQISKLIGTTKPTIGAIRERSHWNMPNIKPQNPVGLGLCSATDLDRAVNLARTRARNKAIREARAKARAEKQAAAAAAATAAAASPPPPAEGAATPAPSPAPGSDAEPNALTATPPPTPLPVPEPLAAEIPAPQPQAPAMPQPAAEPAPAAPTSGPDAGKPGGGGHGGSAASGA